MVVGQCLEEWGVAESKPKSVTNAGKGVAQGLNEEAITMQAFVSNYSYGHATITIRYCWSATREKECARSQGPGNTHRNALMTQPVMFASRSKMTDEEASPPRSLRRSDQYAYPVHANFGRAVAADGFRLSIFRGCRKFSRKYNSAS